MENKPINSEAFGYVRLHIPEKVNLDDFIIIEKFVCEMHNSFFPDGIYGDGDLRKYVHEKLKENDSNIPYQLVDKIVNVLYDFLCDSDTLLPINLSVNLESWKDWEQVLQKSIRDFISSYSYLPNTLSLSTYTKSQMELVSEAQSITSFHFMESIGKGTNMHTLKFCIDDCLIDKKLVLKHTPHNDDDDDDFPYRELPINTPSSIYCIFDS